ncbi:hypothetical protein QN277_026485 [Acacia crassicarpa]|uniref:Uncharacterized protein n=1 Tax=Acacia crassicarpa TaxID=499986 RepID=A0AAE1K6P7_9FABA|nr:hypothetical protein QN277_026485 [Acacia crassicarpa]
MADSEGWDKSGFGISFEHKACSSYDWKIIPRDHVEFSNFLQGSSAFFWAPSVGSQLAFAERAVDNDYKYFVYLKLNCSDVPSLSALIIAFRNVLLSIKVQ